MICTIIFGSCASCVNSHSFILVSQLFRYPSHTHFCVTPSSKNTLYVHVGNFKTVFIYRQIPNFTNCKPSITFENYEHPHFISQSIVQPATSFIVVNVFLLLLAESVYHECTVCSGIMFTPYTFCSRLFMVDAERFSAVRKCITACNSYSLRTHFGGSSMFTLQ